ncbi:MAG: DUF1611 domain-containing protein [Geminicoccaceae bacterium]
MIPSPYLLFLADKRSAKVAQGLRYWRPEACIGQLRSEDSKLDLGIPDMSVQEAAAAGAKTLIVGVANRGGRLSRSWTQILLDALDAGLDLASGLHDQLSKRRELVRRARDLGRSLHDVRVHARRYPLATGADRPGKRCLAIGTDSSVGKMFTMLAMAREMHRQGRKATFRATGQTGIFIAGEGAPLDALIGDFLSGAIEELTPANHPDHWDLIEGQGSLHHPSYSNLTTALLHGACPDALILCHEPTRTNLRGLRDLPPPSLEDSIDLALRIGHVVNPRCRVAGISINTGKLPEDEAYDLVAKTEQRIGLPTADPLRHGAKRLIDALD